MIKLERNSCEMKDTNYILPDPMAAHSCAVMDDVVWICAGTAHATRCYT